MKSYLLIAIPGLILCATCRRHSDEYDRGRFSGLKLLREGKLMLRAIVIATAIGLAAPSYAQVRVITGDVEHIYGPGGEILEVRSLGQRTSVRKARCAASRGALNPLSNKGCPSSRAVHVERPIVGHDTSPRRVGGTTITMNRPRARGAASEQTADMRRCVLGPPA